MLKFNNLDIKRDRNYFINRSKIFFNKAGFKVINRDLNKGNFDEYLDNIYINLYPNNSFPRKEKIQNLKIFNRKDTLIFN